MLSSSIERIKDWSLYPWLGPTWLRLTHSLCCLGVARLSGLSIWFSWPSSSKTWVEPMGMCNANFAATVSLILPNLFFSASGMFDKLLVVFVSIRYKAWRCRGFAVFD